jgi:PRTRC genetic system protein A
VPPREVLFHLLYDTSERKWTLVTPEQIQTEMSVKPVDDSPASSYAQAVIEVHSHHRMSAFFSEQDDRDEQGFRLYGVIGNLNKEGNCPSLRLRAGVYGSFHEVPAEWVFEMPDNLNCVVTAGQRQAGKGL